MRKRGGGANGRAFGWIMIAIGVIIILAMILPAGFWWFALAAALIGVGIWIMRGC